MKYTFDIVCSGREVGDFGFERVKLVQGHHDYGEEKTIELCDSHPGAYAICRHNGAEFFEFSFDEEKYSFREGDSCDGWTDAEHHSGGPIPLEDVQ